MDRIPSCISTVCASPAIRAARRPAAERISSGRSDFIGALGMSRLDDLSPNEIQRVNVLTGPAATTQYGLNAWNGVILITTRRPASDAPKWTAYFEDGVLSAPSTQFADTYFGWGHEPMGNPSPFPARSARRSQGCACSTALRISLRSTKAPRRPSRMGTGIALGSKSAEVLGRAGISSRANDRVKWACSNARAGSAALYPDLRARAQRWAASAELARPHEPPGHARRPTRRQCRHFLLRQLHRRRPPFDRRRDVQ